MRLALLLVLALVATPALSQVVTPHPDGAATITLTCDTGGTATVKPTVGRTYELIATGDLNMCFAATCSSPNGDARPKGNHGLFFIEAGNLSCRSLDGTSQLVLVPVQVAK